MLRPQPIGPVPEETARVASAAFPKGHPYLRLADALGTLFTAQLFAPLFPAYGQPACAPWPFALFTLLHFSPVPSDPPPPAALRPPIPRHYFPPPAPRSRVRWGECGATGGRASFPREGARPALAHGRS